MKNRKRILAAGCVLLLAFTPVVSYADTLENPVQTSPRLGIPVVGAKASAYSNVAISHVSNYVNVRTAPNTTSGIVGKLYNNCAATILATVDGEGGKWYQIQSGNVNGYIKAEYFITGAEAEKIAKDVGTVYVTINTTTLRLREEPNTTSRTLTLLSQDAEYIEIKEEGDFVEIQVDSDLSGYVHKDYIEQRVEFDVAVSLEEEQKQKEETEKLKKEADDAIAVLEQLKQQADGGQSAGTSGTTQTAPDGSQVTAGSQAAPGGTQTAPAGSGSQTAPGSSQTPVGIIAANPNEPNGSETTSGTSGTIGNTQGPTASGSGMVIGDGSGPGGGTTSKTDSNTNKTTSAQEYGPGGEIGPGMTAPSGGKSQTGPGSTEIASATRTAVVAYAKQFLGNPYVYGGTSLTDGADCSGFTMKVFEHFGISTGRTSRDQADKGKEISLDAIQPGDLLFYANGDYINHVALYIGGGQVIHASTPQRGITISTAYYRTPYKAVTFLD